MSRKLVATLVVFLAALPLGAQSGSRLVGQVSTGEGIPLPHFVLTLRGPGGERAIVTGPQGRYRVEGLAPGEYSLRLDTPGVELEGAGSFSLLAGEQVRDVVVTPAPIRERVVVSATRHEALTSDIGVSVSALDADEIEARQAPALLDLIHELPGVSVARTGAYGNQGSVFIRGGNSNAARVMVDGVAVNEPGGGFDFGGALPFELERVEIVRGATSSLYGTDALAGVIQVITRRGHPGERPGFFAALDAGSFERRQLQGGSYGTSGSLDWNVGLLRLETENEQPNDGFEQTSGAASVGIRLSERTDLRFVARLADGRSGTPGQTLYGRPDLDAYSDRNHLVLGARMTHEAGRLLHGLELGYSRLDQVSVNPEDSGSFVPMYEDREGSFAISDFPNPEGFQNDARRSNLGYKLEAPRGSALLTVGADVEHETGALGDRRGELIEPTRTNFGGYAQLRAVWGGSVFLTAGGRIERNDSYGTRAVPRAAVAWRARGGADATTLRASAGAGIKEPSFFESFGTSFFAKGNPDLKPERSRTFDVGIDQRFLDGRGRAEATFYHHDYLDQIAFQTIDFTTFEGSYINLGKTRAQGVELVLELRPIPAILIGGQYTYLDGEIIESGNAFSPVFAEGESLLRRPAHQGAIHALFESGRVRLGADLLFVGSRTDSDFLGLGLTHNESYARLDARVRVAIAGGLDAYLVGDNLTDERYQEALGYAALGRAVRVGLSFRSGR